MAWRAYSLFTERFKAIRNVLLTTRDYEIGGKVSTILGRGKGSDYGSPRRRPAAGVSEPRATGCGLFVRVGSACVGGRLLLRLFLAGFLIGAGATYGGRGIRPGAAALRAAILRERNGTESEAQANSEDGKSFHSGFLRQKKWLATTAHAA